jgi:peptidoglycan L-alanyl-D-glutamate endopeptidase CwlK
MYVTDRTEDKLKGVHPDLVSVIHQTYTRYPGLFIVTEGLRTLEKQKQLFASGATTTLKSRHLTGHAVDVVALVDGEVRWDWPLYRKIADAIKADAILLNVRVQWGGDWKTFKDGPHFQLDPRVYP